MNAKLVRQPNHNHQTWVSTAALDATQIGHVNFGIDGEFFLAQAAPLSELKDVRANYGLPVHRENGRDNDYSHQGL